MVRCLTGVAQGLLFGEQPAPPLITRRPPAPLCLTLWRPWTWAILRLPPEHAKRIENRPWPPPAWILGRWILLHAGDTYDRGGADWIRREHCPGAEVPPPPALDPGGIVGAMTITGDMISRPGMTDPTGWLACPSERTVGYGWKIGGVFALPSPVATRGYQKLWGLHDVQARVAVEQQLPAEIRAGLILR